MSKIIFRILVLALILGIIYVAAFGPEDLYGLLDSLEDIIKAIADNYLKK